MLSGLYDLILLQIVLHIHNFGYFRLPTQLQAVLIHLLNIFVRRLLKIWMRSESLANLRLSSVVILAPSPSLLASQMILRGWFFLKCLISVMCFISSFICWNGFSCSSPHFYSFVLLCNHHNGAHIFAKFGINLFIWFKAPISERSSLIVFGRSLSVMA